MSLYNQHIYLRSESEQINKQLICFPCTSELHGFRRGHWPTKLARDLIEGPVEPKAHRH